MKTIIIIIIIIIMINIIIGSNIKWTSWGKKDLDIQIAI